MKFKIEIELDLEIHYEYERGHSNKPEHESFDWSFDANDAIELIESKLKEREVEIVEIYESWRHD